MQIIPVSEGSFTIDQSKVFIPFDEEKDSLKQRSSGSLLVEIQPFVIKTDQDILLIDTGLGFSNQLENNLKNAGIEPSAVTKVLLSHLHKDHAGGVSRKEGEKYRIRLPNANYYFQRKELDHAFEKGFPSYITDELACLREATNVQLIDGDGVLNEYIRYQVTGAHSKYHQVFWIEENGELVFFGGDDAPQLHQMKHRFTAKYDYDGKKAMELRQTWWEQGKKENWKFLFYHDIKTPVYVHS